MPTCGGALPGCPQRARGGAGRTRRTRRLRRSGPAKRDGVAPDDRRAPGTWRETVQHAVLTRPDIGSVPGRPATASAGSDRSAVGSPPAGTGERAGGVRPLSSPPSTQRDRSSLRCDARSPILRSRRSALPGPRFVLAPAGDRAVDQSRVGREQAGRVESEACQRPGPVRVGRVSSTLPASPAIRSQLAAGPYRLHSGLPARPGVDRPAEILATLLNALPAGATWSHRTPPRSTTRKAGPVSSTSKRAAESPGRPATPPSSRGWLSPASTSRHQEWWWCRSGGQSPRAHTRRPLR